MGKSKKRNNEGAGEGNSSVEVVEKEIEVISSAIICKLCLDEISPENKIILDSCGCFYCLSCMKSYVEVQVSEGFVLSLTCPDADCIIQGTLSIDEVSRLAQREIFEKYLRLKYEQEVASDPLRTFCPNVHCSSVCHVYLKQQHEQSNSHKKKKKKKQEDSVKAGQPVSVACQTCYTTFCNICKAEWTAEHKCTDMNSSISNDLTRLQARTRLSLTGKADALIKRCPVCNVLIEKDRGCAQMICKNCTHVFCWYCLKLLDKDFMLRHYDEGPCRKFLGHSRAQVFRHRLGVVGLFTAFSLLLVVASPILLLTAPVFLCCKCKICCQRAIHQARQHNNNTIFSESFSESRNLPNKKENSPQVVVETTSQEHSSTPLEETVTPTHTTTDNCTVEQTTL